MTKQTKNIIGICIIVIAIVGMYFTVNCMKDHSIDFELNNTSLGNRPTIDKLEPPQLNENNNIDNNQTTDEQKQDNNTEDSNNKKENYRKNMPDKRNDMKNNTRENFKDNNILNNKPDRKNRDLYFILFGLESAVIGATIVFIIYNNKNEKKK